MAIQQVASSSSNGIMSFLFQDDSGPVDDGFGKTLNQLLGEHDGTDALADDGSQQEAATAQSAAITLPSAELDLLASDFHLPDAGTSAEQATNPTEPDKEAVPGPFWNLAPFGNTQTPVHDAELINAQNTNDSTTTAHTAPESSAPTPAFSQGLEQVVQVAREAQQVSAEFTQAASPAGTATLASGRNPPAGGKFLPQAFRPSATTFNATAAGTRAQALPVDAMADLKPSEVTGPHFEALLNTATATEFTGSDTRNQTATPPTVQAPIPNLPRLAGTESSAASPTQVQSPYVAGSEAWFEDLGTRVEWLQDMNIESAELQLHPAELGLLEIHIATSDDATTVSFVTHNAAARELIEDSLPRLRELFAGQGMQLGESQVSQHSEGQQREQAAQRPDFDAQHKDGVDDAAPARRRATIVDPNRIDHYV